MIWGQAGGSLKADSAGVWWGSMSFDQCLDHNGFTENQDFIEKDWDKVFADRKNEIVFIGQDMDKQKVISELDACLSTDIELSTQLWKSGYEDQWPVQRTYALG